MSTGAPLILSVLRIDHVTLGCGPGSARLEVLRFFITVLLRLLGCRVVNGLRIFRGFGGFHESLELLIELVGFGLLEYLDISAIALVEFHQLLVKAILLFLLPLLELGWITWRLRHIVALLLTAGNT